MNHGPLVTQVSRRVLGVAIVSAMTAVIEFSPIGHVRGGRINPNDDNWDDETCEIMLDPQWFSEDSTKGLDAFSHVEVVYHLHLVDQYAIVSTARRPRGRVEWPAVGIFAQRGPMRPNRIGVTTCKLLAVEGLSVKVRGLDAVDGTPVLDVKPFMKGFSPRGDVYQPFWADEIMGAYW